MTGQGVRAELRQAAEKATPGPWSTGNADGYQTVRAGGGYVVCDVGTADAAFIAAASPDVVLALLAERDALAEQVDAWRRHRGSSWHSGCSGCIELRNGPVEQPWIATRCAICGDPTHSTERHEETFDDDF